MVDFDWPLSLRFLLALALSFLVGLERETSSRTTKGKVFAGVRTYSLIGVFGFTCALLLDRAPWVMPAGIIVLASLAVAGYLGKLKEGHVGWTSEVAVLITFTMGSLCLLTDVWVPMAVGIAITLLLSEKAKVENFVEHLDRTEFHAVVRFLIVSVIILPVLPDQAYTQFALNPRSIWKIVVLVSSLGFGGYFLAKQFGDRVGLWMSGLLGGIVSSTAVAVSAGRFAQQRPHRCIPALQASLIASSVMYVRVLALIWFIQPGFVAYMWPKLTILAVIGTILCCTLKTRDSRGQGESVQPEQNPFEIRPALVFASLFVMLSIVTVAVTRFYGEPGLLVLAGVVGVSDIDPFILSLANHAESWQPVLLTAILLSMMSNTLMKGIYFGFLAQPARKQTIWRYGIWVVLHIPLILFDW